MCSKFRIIRQNNNLKGWLQSSEKQNCGRKETLQYLSMGNDDSDLKKKARHSSLESIKKNYSNLPKPVKSSNCNALQNLMLSYEPGSDDDISSFDEYSSSEENNRENTPPNNPVGTNTKTQNLHTPEFKKPMITEKMTGKHLDKDSSLKKMKPKKTRRTMCLPKEVIRIHQSSKWSDKDEVYLVEASGKEREAGLSCYEFKTDEETEGERRRSENADTDDVTESGISDSNIVVVSDTEHCETEDQGQESDNACSEKESEVKKKKIYKLFEHRSGKKKSKKSKRKKKRPLSSKFRSLHFPQKKIKAKYLPNSGYQCHICKEIFKKKSLLSKHNLIHTGKRLLFCNVCNGRFFYYESLNEHKKVHINADFPYSCSSCGKHFKNDEQRRQHQLNHVSDVDL